VSANDDRFLELAGLFLEGAADADALEALDRIVRSDAGARRTLALLVDQHATLRRLHAGPESQCGADARPAGAPARPAARRPRLLSRFGLGLLGGAAAAALLVAALAWLLLGDGGGTKAPAPAPQIPSVAKTPPPPAVAPRPAFVAPERAPEPPLTRETPETAGTVALPKRPAEPPRPPTPPPAASETAPAVAQQDDVDVRPPVEAPPPAPDTEAPGSFTGLAPYDPDPSPAPASSTPTVAVVPVARIERAEGSVQLVRPGAADRMPAAEGKDIPRGAGLVTGAAGSRAVVKYPDGTRLEVGPETTIASFTQWRARGAAPGAAGGKYLLLQQGTLTADVAAQPKGIPMILGTPLADIQVLGTRLAVAAGPESTRVEVRQGAVAVMRRSDRAAVSVRAGQVVETGPSGPLAVKAIPPAVFSVVTVRFGPAGTDVPAGARLDSGDELDAGRGHGWLGSKERRRSQVSVFQDPHWVTKGREPRAFAKAPDAMHASGVSAGSPWHIETWEMPLANGRYLVSVCAGDADAAQGPHHVVVEGQPAIAAAPTAAGAFVEREDVPVTVRDGRLTVAVGGHRGAAAPNRDRPGETTLVYLVVKKVAE